MLVKLRLQRFGAKKRPFYRIVAAANANKRDGKFLEIVGLYHPVSPEDKQVRLNEERILYWLKQGAQPTDTVKNVLSKHGIWSQFMAEKSRLKAERKKRKKEKKDKKPQATQKAAETQNTPNPENEPVATEA
ncbi:MAG: 30S ribosomal protein S16 [Candidatus Hydrogenedentota bacterium]|nr:MAG: 30S ribosomal protein S16 [Candidatus Hydrogenedentota bacterium]